MNENELNNAVQSIKDAILQSQYLITKMANANQLFLYYGIGKSGKMGEEMKNMLFFCEGEGKNLFLPKIIKNIMYNNKHREK